MDPEIEPSLRILSGSPEMVEHEANLLLKNYAAIMWNFSVVRDELVITVILVHERELRKAQLAQMRSVPGIRQ